MQQEAALSLIYMHFEGHDDKEKFSNAMEYVKRLATKHVNQKAQLTVEVPVHLQVADVVDTIGFPMDDPMWLRINSQKRKKLTIRKKKRNTHNVTTDWIGNFLILIGSANNDGNRRYLDQFLKGNHYMSSFLPDIDSNFLDNFMRLVKELKCMYPKESRPIKALGVSKYPEYVEPDKWPDSRHLFGVLHKLSEAWKFHEDGLRSLWNQRPQ